MRSRNIVVLANSVVRAASGSLSESLSHFADGLGDTGQNIDSLPKSINQLAEVLRNPPTTNALDSADVRELKALLLCMNHIKTSEKYLAQYATICETVKQILLRSNLFPLIEWYNTSKQLIKQGAKPEEIYDDKTNLVARSKGRQSFERSPTSITNSFGYSQTTVLLDELPSPLPHGSFVLKPA